MLEQKLFFPG